jgi:hypothetical protein
MVRDRNWGRGDRRTTEVYMAHKNGKRARETEMDLFIPF